MTQQPPISFTVPGIPRAKGSFRVFRAAHGRPIVAKDSEKTYAWESTVSLAAKLAMGDQPPLEGPVEIRMVFRFPRPQAHYNRAGLRAGMPAAPAKKPDWDKVARSTGDALAGICYGDDAQVVEARVAKRWGEPGVSIEVEAWCGAPSAPALTAACGAGARGEGR